MSNTRLLKSPAAGRPPNVAKLFPHSRTLVVMGQHVLFALFARQLAEMMKHMIWNLVHWLQSSIKPLLQIPPIVVTD